MLYFFEYMEDINHDVLYWCNDFIHFLVFSQKPEKHLGVVLLRPEGYSAPDRTAVLSRRERGEILLQLDCWVC